MLHRDLKAQNVFLTSKQQDEVRIGDFGLAKQQSEEDFLSQTEETKRQFRFQIDDTSNVGTPFYLAPELVFNMNECDSGPGSNQCSKRNEVRRVKHPYTPKSDMWALGVILYEMCALRKPFIAQNEEELYKKVRETK